MTDHYCHRSVNVRIISAAILLCVSAAACATTPGVSDSQADVVLFRRLSSSLNVLLQQSAPHPDPILIGDQFLQIIDDSSIPKRQTAEIVFDAISAYQFSIANVDQVRRVVAETIFENDPAGFLMAVGYSKTVNLEFGRSRQLHQALLTKLRPLMVQGSSALSATYEDKQQLAALLRAPLEEGRLSERQILMVLKSVLLDLNANMDLNDKRILLILKMAFYETRPFLHEMESRDKVWFSDNPDEVLARHIEFVELVFQLGRQGLADRARLLRALDHYFGSTAKAIKFVLKHGWASEDNDPVKNAQIIGRALLSYSVQEILDMFIETHWAAPIFEYENPDSFGGPNATVMHLLFPSESPRRAIALPLAGKRKELPPARLRTEQTFLEFKDILGNWTRVATAIKASGSGLEPELMASIIHWETTLDSWASILRLADYGPDQIIANGDIVFGAGQGLTRYFKAIRLPREQFESLIARTARDLSKNCLTGFRRFSQVLIAALEQDMETNRRYLSGGWKDMSVVDTCDSGDGRELFIKTFLDEWSEGSPLLAVERISDAMGIPKEDALTFLAENGFGGMTETELIEAYVAEDLAAQRRLTD